MPNISIIISTYNSVEWLEKVLWGFNCQIYKSFEVVIADDGSGQETTDAIDRLRQQVFYPIKHVWHEDNGFQKCKILNLAIKKTSASYIIMTDGDCIPREDFVQVHHVNKQKGYFISGGYYMFR